MEGPTSKKTKEPLKRASHKGNTKLGFMRNAILVAWEMVGGWTPLFVPISYYTSFE
jgi:hypothetical protein